MSKHDEIRARVAELAEDGCLEIHTELTLEVLVDIAGSLAKIAEALEGKAE